ncbi:uncharacterized protein LOC130988470 [Salvia miltiorrhiza]|uniref:uncharacterized protein LOC130988470 n=1 Tax=Salvia miltiorrhiza TaxID=226208 RepID=UPI0025AC375D|nr:uncharacterized protein LOC130988470 [Salvia miltiorrhiza]
MQDISAQLHKTLIQNQTSGFKHFTTPSTMASTLTAPQVDNLHHFIGKNYEISLNQSIENLLTSVRKSNVQNSINFVSEFQEFVQSKPDPPLESIWVYAALNFSSQKTEPFSRLSEIRDSFQLIVSCSASCNAIKSIALVAPVIYNLHKLILDLKSIQLGSKKERKICGEIKSLVDSVLGYINVCYSGFDQNFDELEGLNRPLLDLISFWLVGNGDEAMNAESLRVFFPLLSDDIANRVSAEGCEMIDLAGFVIAEAFLLKLCWKICEEGFGEKVQNDLRYWIVGSVTGLRSSYFYATLLRMLLEPVLPISSLVNLEHLDDLKKVLFHALLLVDYSFLSPGSLGKLPAKHAKRVMVTKLIANHEAIESFREQGDQTKTIAYLDAFANSSLPSLIIKWIRNELGSEFSTIEPTGTSPRAFIRWMLNIENKGIKIFDDDMSKFCSAFDSKEASEQLADMEGGRKPDSDLLFYMDYKGREECGSEEDEEMSGRMNAAFTSAAHSMGLSEQGGRKRKTKDGKKRKKVKFVKYNISEQPSLSKGGNDDSDGASDLENPSSDMEVRD